MSTCCPPTGCTRKCPATTRAWPPPGGLFNKGFYAPCGTPVQHRPGAHRPAPRVLDTGCGEGTTPAGVYRALVRQGGPVTMAGTDISRPSSRRAAKREKDVEFAVASRRIICRWRTGRWTCW